MAQPQGIRRKKIDYSRCARCGDLLLRESGLWRCVNCKHAPECDPGFIDMRWGRDQADNVEWRLSSDDRGDDDHE
jgi:hypothetical protein